MISTPEEAVRLLNKWKADASLMYVSLTDSYTSTGQTFEFDFKGTLRDVSSSSLGISDGNCLLSLSLVGATFEYFETRDAALTIPDEDRRLAKELYERCLAITLPGGKLCVLCELNQDEEYGSHL